MARHSLMGGFGPRDGYLLAVIASVLQGCVPVAPQDYKQYAIDTTEAVRAAALNPGDVFEVTVHGQAELSGTHRVSPEGDVDFPLVGRAHVDGLTSGQIADLFRERLMNGFLRNPTVSVFVKEITSKKVFVLGQVAKPGAFSFEDSMTVVQAIALSGGFTPFAQQNNVFVSRRDKGAEQRIRVPVEQIATDSAATNFLLRPGDIVFVPETAM